MQPTDVLSAEHRVIEQVLDCLERMAAAARAEGGLDVERAAEALEVLRTFADRCHHGKEEGRLFPLMERRGLPRNVGPIAVMLSDHEVGRGLIRQMGEALGDARSGGEAAPGRFADAAGAYVELLRDHIAKEDGVLFPLAESLLDDEARAELRAEFERFEREDLEPGTIERMRALADELARHYDVPLAAQRSKPAVQGHGCFH